MFFNFENCVLWIGWSITFCAAIAWACLPSALTGPSIITLMLLFLNLANWSCRFVKFQGWCKLLSPRLPLNFEKLGLSVCSMSCWWVLYRSFSCLSNSIFYNRCSWFSLLCIISISSFSLEPPPTNYMLVSSSMFLFNLFMARRGTLFFRKESFVSILIWRLPSATEGFTLLCLLVKLDFFFFNGEKVSSRAFSPYTNEVFSWIRMPSPSILACCWMSLSVPPADGKFCFYLGA